MGAGNGRGEVSSPKGTHRRVLKMIRNVCKSTSNGRSPDLRDSYRPVDHPAGMVVTNRREESALLLGQVGSVFGNFEMQ